eukprot:COSAG06_NODE_3934_length_4749_cov_430.643656_2_plen_80_part_00
MCFTELPRHELRQRREVRARVLDKAAQNETKEGHVRGCVLFCPKPVLVKECFILSQACLGKRAPFFSSDLHLGEGKKDR